MGDSIIKIVAIVRDKDGNPKVDNFPNCSRDILNALTEKDKEYLWHSLTLRQQETA